MTSRTPSRADDERLLAWLALRDRGASSAGIGAQYGVAAAGIRIATTRVRRDDIAEEPSALRFYAWGA